MEDFSGHICMLEFCIILTVVVLDYLFQLVLFDLLIKGIKVFNFYCCLVYFCTIVFFMLCNSIIVT